jgi:hypothetical protein
MSTGKQQSRNIGAFMVQSSGTKQGREIHLSVVDANEPRHRPEIHSSMKSRILWQEGLILVSFMHPPVSI